MKNIINNLKFIDILLAGLLSFFLAVRIYDFLYLKCTYSKLNDFYVGTSIYLDHNKNLDIYIYFIYLFIFFCIYSFAFFLRQKFFVCRNDIQQIKIKEIKYSEFLYNIKNFLLKYQILGVFGFVFLYPLNGKFYPIVLTILFLFVLLSVFDVLRIKYSDKNNRFSSLIITGIIFAFIFCSYNIVYGPTDDHHFGEKFATFLMHNNFNLDYYKDIMLVHGYLDVIPSWIGCYIFNENNIYGYCLGETLFKNLLIILTIYLGLIIFENNKLFIAPLLLYKATNPALFFITTYLLIIKEHLVEKRYIWLCIYSLISFAFCMIWTTIGTFLFIASIPMLLYQIYEIFKLKDSQKLIKIIVSLLPVMILLVIMHPTIIEYLKEAPEYIKGNLYAFGNTYGKLNLCLPRLFVCIYKFFALLFVPVLILELIKQVKIKKSASSVYFLLFAIIFPIISLSYTLGRMDYGLFFRLEYISQAYILLILPYFLYKYSKKNINILLTLILISILILSSIIFPLKLKYLPLEKDNNSLCNTGSVNFKTDYKKRIESVKYFVENNSNKDSIFLDLTNRGMHYLYLNKKIPIKFISFYNAISSKQSSEIVQKLTNNLPDIILIDSDSIFHDNIRLSLRLNSLYRCILLSLKYKVVFSDNNNTFLIKTDGIANYSKEEINKLDNIFGTRELNFLPEAWGNSVKNLPLEEVMVDSYNYIDYNSLNIRFPDKISGETFDFIYIEPVNKLKQNQNFYIQINNSDSELSCKVKKTGKMLIPFDSFPSWLLNKDVNEINVYSNKEFNGEYIIKFYKRKS